MVMPTLIHPVPIQIRTIERAATIYDHDANEPVQQAARGIVVTLLGQISFMGAGQSLKRTKQGPSEDDTGYVLFRLIDLQGVGVAIKFNDRIVKMGNLVVDYYVTKLMPMAHYSDIGGAGLIKCNFTDRQPQKQGAA